MQTPLKYFGVSRAPRTLAVALSGMVVDVAVADLIMQLMARDRVAKPYVLCLSIGPAADAEQRDDGDFSGIIRGR